MATKIIDLDETTVIEDVFVVTEKVDATQFKKVNLQTVVGKANDYALDGISSSASASGFSAKAVAAGDPPQWETDFDAASNYMKEAAFTAAGLDVNLTSRTKLLDTQIKANADAIIAVESNEVEIDAAADLDTGTATAIVASGDGTKTEGVTDSAKAWTIDAYIGKVVVIQEDNMIECGVVASNTADTLTFQEGLDVVFTAGATFRIMYTYEITQTVKTYIDIDTTVNDMAVLLPESVAGCNLVEYIMTIISGANEVYIKTQADSPIIEDVKETCLSSIMESMTLMCHYVAASDHHFHVTNEVFVKTFASLYYDSAYTLTTSTDPELIIDAGDIVADQVRRFMAYTDAGGFSAIVYRTPVPKVMQLIASIIITKASGGGTAGEVTLQFYKNGVALNRSATTYFGNDDATVVLSFMDVSELELSDIITIKAQRSSAAGTYTIDVGSSLIIKEL